MATLSQQSHSHANGIQSSKMVVWRGGCDAVSSICRWSCYRCTDWCLLEHLTWHKSNGIPVLRFVFEGNCDSWSTRISSICGWRKPQSCWYGVRCNASMHETRYEINTFKNCFLIVEAEILATDRWWFPPDPHRNGHLHDEQSLWQYFKCEKHPSRGAKSECNGD